MNTEIIYTERLEINPLSGDDSSFILELVNSEGWLKYIGDRNVRTPKDAEDYISNILGQPETNYWVVKIASDDTAIGVITLIQKAYLEHPDIGFAFLPGFGGKGYAYESTRVLLEIIKKQPGFSTLLGCTLPENARSISLLKKLGMRLKEKITVDGELLEIFILENES